MKTIYDFVSIGIFAGIVLLFLQRSVSDQPTKDALWQYLVAATACAIFNYLGNSGYHAGAVGLLLALLAFIWFVLRPLEPS